jgi:hypothetical protein
MIPFGIAAHPEALMPIREPVPEPASAPAFIRKGQQCRRNATKNRPGYLLQLWPRPNATQTAPLIAELERLISAL